MTWSESRRQTDLMIGRNLCRIVYKMVENRPVSLFIQVTFVCNSYMVGDTITPCLPVSSADNIGKHFGRIVGPDQGPNCFAFWWYS